MSAEKVLNEIKMRSGSDCQSGPGTLGTESDSGAALCSIRLGSILDLVRISSEVETLHMTQTSFGLGRIITVTI